MRRSVLSSLVCLFVAALILACLSPAAATPSPTASARPAATNTAAATVTPTLTVAPTATATPTLTPAPTATFTPAPTDTATATPDPYAGAILTLSDLPAGYAVLTPADRAQLHLTDANLQAAFGSAYANAHVHNFAGFVHGATPNFQLVATYLLYPLNHLEQAALDVTFSDPATFAKLFAAGASDRTQGTGATLTVKALPGMNKFGDKSAGVSALLTTASGSPVRVDVVAVRRAGVLEIYNSIYPDKTHPPVAPGDLVNILDARVAAVKP